MLNLEALAKLATMLEADAANENGMRFDLGDVGSFQGDAPSVSCNTTGCAIGLAALSGEFPRLGYTINQRHKTIDVTLEDEETYYIHAAKEIFGLSSSQALHLFSPSMVRETLRGSRGELYVANRIRELINKYNT